jgi:signal transduction histidine kinase
MNWSVIVLLPVAFVLLNGLLIFVLITLSTDSGLRRPILVVATAGAVVICAVVFMVMAVVFRRPMLELQEKIAMVRLGDLHAMVEFASRNDEIGDLGRDFNAMVRQLRESHEEIQHLHRTQMSRAEHLATLGELAAGLAHEIRNPLAGIAGVIEIIGRDLPKESPARKVLKDVHTEVAHINRIVSDLLEIARPKAPVFSSSDVVATAEQALLFAREQAMAKSISLDLIKDEPLPPIEHDSGQIQQVLLNLLLNAIQACEEKGSVKVEFGQDKEEVWIAVTDTGRGISRETLPNIFRPFFTTKGNGTGLGLPLAKRVVEDHNGRIEVESWPGKGSRFVVCLPKRQQSAVN